MTVSAILKRKGTDVFTIISGATVTEALGLLSEHNIGAVVVCDSSNNLLGILSERDIVRSISQNGPSAIDMKVDKIMTDKVVTCVPEDTIKHVMSVMSTRKFRHMPVVFDGQLGGFLSIGDVVKYRLDEAKLEIDVMRDQARLR